MNQGRSVSLEDGIFFRGDGQDYPVLMPLTGTGGKAVSPLEFCREIAPGAAILLPDLRQYGRLAPVRNPDRNLFIAERISAFLIRSIAELELTLRPIIIMGYGPGADLGVKFMLRHGANLAAAILYRPTAPVSSGSVPRISGLHVLLVTTMRADIAGSSEWKIKNALSSGGAQVICEYVAPGSRRGKHDAALARVFLASLFGPNA